jgi:4-hydroxy-tetrahydrodipicolinate synthase
LERIAIVTPFKDGRVDEPRLERLVKAQIKGGVDGIVPVGTTGNRPSPWTSTSVVELSVKFAAGKIKVLAGTGANATSEAIYLTKAAEEAGADGSLQVAPYYNKPTQEGLFQHFHSIARSTKLPIVLYSIPGRCGVEIAVDTVNRLAADSVNIVGIKEAGKRRSGQPASGLAGQRLHDLKRRHALTLPFMAVGRKGRQRGVNVAARGFEHGESLRHGKLATALKLHGRLYALFKDLFIETNPSVKAAWPCWA